MNHFLFTHKDNSHKSYFKYRINCNYYNFDDRKSRDFYAY